ncbi:HotDog domain-containing protein [Schizophyllum fasciatum]
MSVDLAKVVGHKAEDVPVDWNRRDLLLYAAGIGAKKDDLPLVYELHKDFAPIPTYPVVLQLKGAGSDVNLFSDRMKGKPIPGLPALDPNRVVHGSQSIEILKPLPLESGPGWKWTSRYVAVAENKSGIVLTAENTLVGADGQAYAKLYSSSFNVGAKATGQRFAKAIAGPPQAKPTPQRAPDYVFKDQTTPEQALIYRLSGDYNPLHIDPRIGKYAGFGGVILHGLSTFGFAARAVIATVAGGDPRALTLFGVRFTSPVRPGDALETKIWEVEGSRPGEVELVFETVNVTTGKVALGSGIAHVKKAQSKL